MSFKSPSATNALAMPIAVAASEIGITLSDVVKSPRRSAGLFGPPTKKSRIGKAALPESFPYLTASGFSGEPTPPEIFSGGAQKRHS